MNRILFFTITSFLYLTFSSPIRAQEQQNVDMVKISNFWLVHHNEIEKVINTAYYSWVNGDGDTFLSFFTPDVVWYYTYESHPEVYGVWMMGKDDLKKNVADKAKEVKSDFSDRWLVVQNINVAPESKSWEPNGEAGNACGIAVAGVEETSIDKKNSKTTTHPYIDTYMMKRINGKWMITGVIRKVMAIQPGD